MLTEEGYVSLGDNKYHYYLKDHEGNNRVVINQSGGVEETNHYYPSGGLFASTGNVQPYKYNGKEYDSRKGLNWYDYGARHYDAALGRWHVMDQQAEKSYSYSPYVYCLNNPVKNIDPDGKQVIPAPVPLPVPMPIYYAPYKPVCNYPTSQDVVKGMNNIMQGMKTNTSFFIGAALMSYEQTKQALSPEYKHQRNRDRRNREGLDQNQANVAKSIKDNITATTPSGDPMPKRDPEDWNKGAVIPMGIAVGSEFYIQLNNPDPSRDAHEVRQEQIEQKDNSSRELRTDNLLHRFIDWLIKK